MRRAAGMVLALVATFHAALAADCTARKSKVDRFGVATLGPMTDARMSRLAKREAGCDYAADPSCTYVDANGISYGVVEDYLESKTITLSNLRAGAALPYGLSRTETVSSVRDKLGPRLPVPLLLGTTNGTYLSTDLCLSDRTGPFELWFAFDARGRLKSLGTRIDSVRD